MIDIADLAAACNRFSVADCPACGTETIGRHGWVGVPEPDGYKRLYFTCRSCGRRWKHTMTDEQYSAWAEYSARGAEAQAEIERLEAEVQRGSS